MSIRSGKHEPNPYIGSGWGFPPQFDPETCKVITVRDDTEIAESLTILFGTALGERVLSPGYGSDINTFVFARADATTRGELQHMVQRAIRDYEPRIRVQSVTVSTAADDPARVDVTVDFTVRHSNSRSNIVFPFFLSEGTNL